MLTYRQQMVMAAMQGFCANTAAIIEILRLDNEYLNVSAKRLRDTLAMVSVDFADATIKEEARTATEIEKEESRRLDLKWSAMAEKKKELNK